MKHDRNGGKRTNWLLIKHRDEYAREGDGERFLEDRPIGCLGPHAWTQIAAGKGKAPKPFMTRKPNAPAPMPCGIRTGSEASTEPAAPASASKVRKSRRACRISSRRSSAAWSSSRRRGQGWVHEIKFDGYRMQLRVEDGEASAQDPQGPRLDRQVRRRSRRPRARCPTASSTARSSRSTSTARRISPALQAAISDGKTDDLVFFAFDLLFAEGEDLRALPLLERKAQLKALLRGQAQTPRLIRYVEHFESRRRRDAEIGAASCRWRASSPSSSMRPIVPAAARPGPRPNAAPATRWCIGGWKTTDGKFRSLMVGVYRGDHLAFVGHGRHRLRRRTRSGASCRR